MWKCPLDPVAEWGVCDHWHQASKQASLWSLQVIPAMGKMSFRVLFLPTEEGSIESSLFINTSSHGVLSYQVTAPVFRIGEPLLFLAWVLDLLVFQKLIFIILGTLKVH